MTDTDLVVVGVEQCRGLLAKNPDGSSNSYCVVTVDGRNYVSDTKLRCLDPEFGLRVTMYVTHTHQTPTGPFNDIFIAR